MDALRLDTLERPYRVQSLCVRCVKSYSIVVLTGMDALRLDTLERPYRIQSRLVSSHSASLSLHPHVVL